MIKNTSEKKKKATRDSKKAGKHRPQWPLPSPMAKTLVDNLIRTAEYRAGRAQLAHYDAVVGIDIICAYYDS